MSENGFQLSRLRGPALFATNLPNPLDLKSHTRRTESVVFKETPSLSFDHISLRFEANKEKLSKLLGGEKYGSQKPVAFGDSSLRGLTFLFFSRSECGYRELKKLILKRPSICCLLRIGLNAVFVFMGLGQWRRQALAFMPNYLAITTPGGHLHRRSDGQYHAQA